MKREYQARCWFEAVRQERPDENPPVMVTVHAMLLRCNRGTFRDEDGLKGGLKFLLDALAQKQRGDLSWRSGLFVDRGYFVNDSPRHLRLGEVWQEKCATKDLECMVIEILPTWPAPTTLARAGRTP